MSTFAELAAKAQGVGVAILLEGSTDLFATTPYLFSTHDGRFGGSTDYDPRIIGVGDLQRGFGTDGTLAASSVALRLSNTDAAMDWLITDSTKQFKVRWKVKLALYDVANPSDLATKLLGVFVNLDNPARDNASVTLNLADDSFGMAAELAIPPTASEAFAVALDSTATDPPCPIAFGEQIIPALPERYDGSSTSIRYVLSATTDTATYSDEVSWLILSGPSLNYRLGESMLEVPSTDVLNSSTGTTSSITLWTATKTSALVKDGRTWRVIYVTINTVNLRDWLTAKGYISKDVITVGLQGQTWQFPMPLSTFNTQILSQLTVEAYGTRWASRTYEQSGLVSTVRAPDIAYDMLRYYSRGLGSSEVNAASFTAASQAAPMFFFKANYYLTNFAQTVTSVASGKGLSTSRSSLAVTTQGLLRRAISELCQGGLFDVVTDWNGQFVAHILANNFALQTATPTVVDETLMSNIADKVPSPGERWAPYNRVILKSNGRVIDNKTAIDEWGGIFARNINDVAVDVYAAVSGTDFGVGTFGGIGVLESKVRPVVSFDYPLDALNWELGDFIAVTWSRGETASGPWTSTVFRVESLTVHPTRGSVTVSAVWIQDLRSGLPYLLDDESYLVRTKNAGDSVLFPTDGSSTVPLFGGGDNFLTMGVTAGDLVVMRDTTLAVDVFTRCRVLRITAVAGRNVTVTGDLDFDFPGGGGIAASEWYIVRGATTYPTAISDPTNYPSGGTMYGKMSEAGTFSNSSTANTMREG